MQKWRSRLAPAAAFALAASACGTAEPTYVMPDAAPRAATPTPEGAAAPRDLAPPPDTLPRDGRWGGFIGGGS